MMLVAILPPLLLLALALHGLRTRMPEVHRLPTITGPIAAVAITGTTARRLRVRLANDSRGFLYGGTRAQALCQVLPVGRMVTIWVSAGPISRVLSVAGIARMVAVDGEELVPFEEVVAYTRGQLRRLRIYAVLALAWLVAAVWLTYPR
jgi:hypothetical protein